MIEKFSHPLIASTHCMLRVCAVESRYRELVSFLVAYPPVVARTFLSPLLSTKLRSRVVIVAMLSKARLITKTLNDAAVPTLLQRSISAAGSSICAGSVAILGRETAQKTDNNCAVFARR